MTLIYIEDSLVDLAPETVVSITINRVDIGVLSSRRITYTDSIVVPITPKNDKLFGHSSNEASASLIPYQKLNCRIVQNGYEVFQNGFALIKKVEGGYKLQVYENALGLFDVVNTLNVRDVAAIVNSGWTASDIDNARLYGNDLIAAVMSWGRSASVYEVNYFLPCFFYHTIVEKILKYTGLTLSGAILTDPNFLNLVIPYFNDTFTYPKNEYSKYTEATLTNFEEYAVPTTDLLVLDYNVETLYQGPATVYTYVRTEGIDYGAGGAFTFKLYINNVFINQFIINSPDQFVQAGTSYATVISPGDNIKIYFTGDAAMDVTVSILGAEVVFTTAINRSLVYWNALFPDSISCKSILTDFFTRFGVLFNEVNGVLHLKTLEEIINDKVNVNDWRGKRASARKEISFETSYSKSNYFRYTKSDEVNANSVGEGVLAINSPNDAAKTILTTVFKNSLTDVVASRKVGIVPVYDNASTGITDFVNKPGIRLMMLKPRTTEASITFNAIARTDYKLAYFADTGLGKDAGFKYFLNTYYKSFGAAIESAKVIEEEYYLDAKDIASYDPLKLVQDEDGFYILDKLSSYVEGTVTKAQLIKI